MRPERYGWRARIGLLVPNSGSTVMREWNSVLPEGISCHQAIMGLGEATPDRLLELREKAVVEAKKLASGGMMDLLIFACTSGSFIGGAGYDGQIIKELEAATSVPSTTTSTCVLTAFADLGVKRMALIGPYIREVFDGEIQFFKDHGIETAYCKGLDYIDPKAYSKLSEEPYVYYRLAKEAYQSVPDIDAIFITCMASPALMVIGTLEQDTGKPVISSCSASLYGVLKKLGVKERVEHYGQLLAMLE